MESDNHELFMDLATLVMAFPPCLSRKRQLRKVLGVLGGSARDDLFPLPVEENAISRLPRKALGVLGGSTRDGLFLLQAPGDNAGSTQN